MTEKLLTTPPATGLFKSIGNEGGLVTYEPMEFTVTTISEQAFYSAFRQKRNMADISKRIASYKAQTVEYDCWDSVCKFSANIWAEAMGEL